MSSWSIHSCFHWCKNYKTRSRNARLIVEKLLASFFPDTVYFILVYSLLERLCPVSCIAGPIVFFVFWQIKLSNYCLTMDGSIMRRLIIRWDATYEIVKVTYGERQNSVLWDVNLIRSGRCVQSLRLAYCLALMERTICFLWTNK